MALIPLGFLVWMVVNRARDRLIVHRNGFTFRRRGETQQCRWDDIDQADIQLGDDRRGLIREVKTDHGTISFGRWMGGLDVLYYAYATEGGSEPLEGPQPSGDGIGALVSTHGVPAKIWVGWLPAWFIGGFLLLVAVVLFVATLDNSSMTGSDLTYATVCLVAAIGFVALLLRLAFADRHDELRIHEHGFAYRHRGTVQECRWDEIANYQQRRTEIWAVMRRDGTWIHLSRYIPQVRTHVRPHLRVAQDVSPPRRRGREITWTEPSKPDAE